VAGLTTSGGNPTITTTGNNNLQVDSAINLGAGSLTASSNRAVVNAGITANGGITFQPTTLTQSMNIGSGVAGDAALNLGGAELALLSTTGQLTFGAAAGTGAITFNGASLGGQSVLSRGGSTAFNTAASSFGTLQLAVNGGGSTVTQTAGLTAGSLGIQAAGSLQLRTLSGDLTLNQAVTANAVTGNSLVLASGGNFINNAGAGALTTAGTARFLIYSADPAANTLGGIAAPAKLYNRTFAGTPPAAVPGTQSTLLYSIAPVITVTADDASREYGVANPAFGFSTAGFIDGDSAATAFAGAPTLGTAATILSDVGAYAITPTIGSLTSALGYSFNFVNGTLNVTPAPLTVTADNATREYGLANPAFTGTITGLRNGDAASVVTGLTYGSVGVGADVGTYAITSSGGTATNYSIATRVDGQLSVTPAPLIVTADDKSRAAGDANPLLTATLAGLVLSTPATAGSPEGSYAITSTGGAATNYTIMQRFDGTLTVTPAVPPPSGGALAAGGVGGGAGSTALSDSNLRQLMTDRTLAPAQTASFAGGTPTPGDATAPSGVLAGPIDPFRLTFALLGGTAGVGGLGAIAPAAGGDQPAGNGEAGASLPELGVEAFLGRWWEWRAASQTEDEAR
jgi:hypothetical protein